MKRKSTHQPMVYEYIRRHREVDVDEIASAMRVSRQTAQHHLNSLLRSGRILRSRVGTFRYFYKINPAAVTLPFVALNLDEVLK